MINTAKEVIAYNVTVNGFAGVSIIQASPNCYFIYGISQDSIDGMDERSILMKFINQAKEGDFASPFICSSGRCCLLNSVKPYLKMVSPNRIYFFCEDDFNICQDR